MTNVNVADNKCSPVSCPSTTLVQGTSMLCNCTTTLTCTAIQNIVNVANVSGNASGTIVTANANATVSCSPVAAPNISITKTANPTSIVSGNNVTYTYNVINTGNVPLTNVNVVDNKCSPVSCPSTTLAQGTSMLCNCTTTLTCTAIQNIVNVANVSGNASGTIVTANANANVTCKPASCTSNVSPEIKRINVPSVVIRGRTMSIIIEVKDIDDAYNTLNLTAVYNGNTVTLIRYDENMWIGTINTTTLGVGWHNISVTVRDPCNNSNSTIRYFRVFTPWGLNAGDPVEAIKIANTTSASINEKILYTINVTNRNDTPMDVYLSDNVSGNICYVGNLTITCTNVNYNISNFSTDDPRINITATLWKFTEDPTECARDWWLNMTNIPPNVTCTMIVTAEVREAIVDPIVNTITVIANNGTAASTVNRSSIVTPVGYCNSDADCSRNQRCSSTTHTCYTPSGGGTTSGGQQPYGGIPSGQVTTTQQISTVIPDTTTPESHCFKIECTTKTYQDGKLTASITKNVSSAANIILTLPNGNNVNVHTNANGEICYQFGCGIYTITIPKGVCGEEYSKTITLTYGKLYITPSDLTKAKVNETLTYLIKDDGGNAVKNANVNILLPDGNLVKTSDYNGKVTFNVGEKEGSYTLTAQKDCYENATLTGTIVMPKLTVTCDSQVKVNATLCCYVKDQDGNNVEGANVKLTMPGGKEIQLISDANGKVCTNEIQIKGDVTAAASKKGYKDSDIATSKIITEEIICPKECKCGCEEGTATCKTCPECNIFGLPCWILLLLLLLIALLLFLLLRKKKIYADEESVNKAIKEGQLENISNKYSKIYVSRKVYDNIQGMDVENKVKNKFEFADLNEKGEKYLKECGNEHVARAKQLEVDILTSNDGTAKKAEENKIKVKRYEES
ncbi:hypothetical protein MSIBF_A3950002 [groundwater metagenome]|uniref:DUF7507 domain-containing protein n=1 Tax=groundwater metagenome TaxID=717931 RepID=A0A098ED54_9ZZZZ